MATARANASPMSAGRQTVVSDEAERLLNEVGQLLAKDTDYPLDGTLLYAELDTNFAGIAIFKNRGNHILYRWDDSSLTYPLLDLWEQWEPGKRWAEMEYVIVDGKFEVDFIYPEEIDPEEDSFERRDRIVRRHFGDKPIVYPPWPPPDYEDLGAQEFEL